MARLACCLLLVASLCVLGTLCQDIVDTNSDDWVTAHNQARRNEPAADMQELVWDTELQDLAEDWAQQCNFDHRPAGERSNIGENIFVSTDERGIDEVVENWYAELVFWDLDAGTCEEGEVCGHYTQVVWAETCSVGCAIAECDDIDNAGGIGSGFLAVCNYGPAGNVAGEKPYVLGEACAECADSCTDDNMCEGQCDAPSEEEEEESEEEETEEEPESEEEEETEETEEASEESAETEESDEDSGPQPPAPPPGTGGACANTHDLCRFWAEAGECQRNNAWMLENCAGACSPSCAGGGDDADVASGGCVDSHPYCAFWASTGECTSNVHYMIWRCKASCHPRCLARAGRPGSTGGSRPSPSRARPPSPSGGGGGLQPPPQVRFSIRKLSSAESSEEVEDKRR